MVYIVWLHCALRILLLFFDRLKSLGLVIVELAAVCCHVFLIRVILTRPQQPPHHRLRAIAICVRTLSRLITIMKPLTVARYAIANEYLRRRKQRFCDAANRTPPEHQVELSSTAIEQTPDKQTTDAQAQPALDHVQSLVTSTANERCDTVAVGVRTIALDKISTASSKSRSDAEWMQGLLYKSLHGILIGHLRKPGVWRPMSTSERTGSTVLAALQPNADRGAVATGANAAKNPCAGGFGLPARDTVTKAWKGTTDHEYQIFTTFCFPAMGASAPRSLPPTPHPEDASDTASPTSDTTLFEDAPVCTPSQLGCDEDIGAYIACNDAPMEGVSITWTPQLAEHEIDPVAKRPVRHRRYVSSQSSFGVTETPQIPLRSRSRTNDGLLLFRANSSKETTDDPKIRHRRKVSLNLPVNTHASQASATQPFGKSGVESCTKRTSGMETAYYTTSVDALTPEERDLEYKHRHTFIGTGSLDDFLETLETTPNHTATKDAITRAFVQLAASEQLYARQCSAGQGWDLVMRTTLSLMDVTSVDYIVQSQVKLGSITLRQFLDLIPFDEVDEVAALRIVEAFSVASHLDATTCMGARSKARAFRKWMVDQKSVDADC